MKKNVVILSLSILGVVLTSFATIANKKPKLAGTKWIMLNEVQMLDGPRTHQRICIYFIDKTNVEETVSTVRDSYSAMRVNSDGTINKIPSESSKNSLRGTYKVKKDVITVTIQDKVTHYHISKDGLFLILGLDEAIYNKLPENQKKEFTFLKEK